MQEIMGSKAIEAYQSQSQFWRERLVRRLMGQGDPRDITRYRALIAKEESRINRLIAEGWSWELAKLRRAWRGAKEPN